MPNEPHANTMSDPPDGPTDKPAVEHIDDSGECVNHQDSNPHPDHHLAIGRKLHR